MISTIGVASLLLWQRISAPAPGHVLAQLPEGAALTRSAMRRLHVATVLFVLVGLLAPATSHAQQSVNFYVGGLVTPDWHEREFTDVVANNLSGGEYGLAFDIHEFNGITAGGEYLVGLNNFLDAGLGVGFYSQRVPSVYA